jgi:4-amino-4-deoxy-L-arabinose transferase-like glycosyltransferase
VKANPWRALLLSAAPLAALAASFFAGFDAHMRQPALAVVAWLVGILAVVAGASEASEMKARRLRAPGVPPHPRPAAWSAIAWGLALLFIALLFRAPLTGQIPMALTGDEASVGISAQRFNQGLTDNLFTVGWFSFPSLFYYLVSISISILGNTIPALRLPSALAGALTVACVYWLGREMFGHRAGLAAGLLLAALHFHVHYSRLGLNNAWDGLFYVVTLGGFWVAWKRNSRPAAILAGLGLGFSQYFYTSGRLLVVLIPLLALWLNRRSLSGLRRLGEIRPNLLVIFWVALAVFLPLGRFFAYHPGEFIAPLNRVSLTPEWIASAMHSRGETALEVVRDQVFLSLEAYTDAPLYSFWYDSRTPILLTIPAILFWLGLVQLALKRQGGQLWLLAGWLLAFSLASMLSQDAPSSQRFVAAAPAAALVVAAGLEGLVEQAGRLWPDRRAVFTALACGLLVWAGINEYSHYFLEYVPQRSYENANALAAHRLASYLHAKPAGTQLAYFGASDSFYPPASVYGYLAPQVQRAFYAGPLGSPGEPALDPRVTVFAFLPGRTADLAQAQASYPGGRLVRVDKPDGSPLLTIYDLTP